MAARAPSRRPPAAEGEGSDTSTRERILDIALDLFVEKGYDKTSLREIAEQLGFSKAAIYYHFASKDDILLALHLRMHALARPFERLEGQDFADARTWTLVLDEVVEEILANRKLILLHLSNRAAMEQVQHDSPGHASEHDDLEVVFTRVLRDPAIPLQSRVRLACAVGALLGGLFLSGEVLKDVPDETLADVLCDVVRDILRPVPGMPRARSPRRRTPASAGGATREPRHRPDTATTPRRRRTTH